MTSTGFSVPWSSIMVLIFKCSMFFFFFLWSRSESTNCHSPKCCHITEVICFIMYISPGIVGSVFNFIMLLKYCLNRTFTHDVGWFTSRHLTPLPKQLTPFKTLNRLWSPWFLWLYAAEIVVCVQSEASASYLLMWTGYCPFSQLLNLCCDSSSRTIEWTQHRWPM